MQAKRNLVGNCNKRPRNIARPFRITIKVTRRGAVLSLLSKDHFKSESILSDMSFLHGG